MNDVASTPVRPKPTLGLVGATLNAMALIAPGAFLWITYQMQAAATSPSGASVASDIWPGIVVALVVAFLTALCYAQLARLYPEAGLPVAPTSPKRRSWTTAARSAAVPGRWPAWPNWPPAGRAHLFYWVYPGVMVAMMAILMGYIYTQFTGKTLSPEMLTGIGVLFTVVTGYIAYRGVTGSTRTSFWVNIIQLVTLVLFTAWRSGIAWPTRTTQPPGRSAAPWTLSARTRSRACWSSPRWPS